MSNREIFIDKLRQLSKEEMLERYIALLNTEKLTDYVADLEAKLAESENKLNKYPYKNDVIEEQYEELKNGIKFRIENNITDDWEQLYHCIDVLCEKHKSRIRDIEDGICRIEQLEQQLAEKEKEIETLKQCGDTDHFYGLLEDKKQEIDICRKYIKQLDQDKISFAVEQLEKVKELIHSHEKIYLSLNDFKIINEIFNNQIEQLKEGK